MQDLHAGIYNLTSYSWTCISIQNKRWKRSFFNSFHLLTFHMKTCSLVSQRILKPAISMGSWFKFWAKVSKYQAVGLSNHQIIDTYSFFIYILSKMLQYRYRKLKTMVLIQFWYSFHYCTFCKVFHSIIMVDIKFTTLREEIILLMNQ